MSALVVSLLGQFWPYILAGLAALAWGWKQRRAGAASERAKTAKRDAAAREERHEMDREADDIERKVRDLTDAEALKEATKWVRD